MKKNKRLSILLCIFSFLVLIVVLSSTVFSVSTISINFLDSSTYFSSSSQEIIQSANFVKGQNIFFVSKKYHIKNMQSAYPYLKIINIETKFPSTLIINAVKRHDLITIKSSNNTYAVCDDELFCTSTNITYSNNDTSPILVYRQESSILSEFEEGKELNLDKDIKKYLKNVLYCLYEYKETNLELTSRIREIVVEFEEKNQIQIKMRAGLNIVINEVNEFTSGKLNYAFSYFESPNATTNQGTLYINHDNSDYIHGYYKA